MAVSGGGKLFCHGEEEFTRYCFDLENKEMKTNKLRDKTTGWTIDIIAETEEEFFVAYETDGVLNADGDSCEIFGMKYGMISKEDFFAEKENYFPIKRAGEDNTIG